MDRKLAYKTVVDDILPIEGADKIEQAVIGGWKTVVAKNEFKPGQPVIYMEVDSFLPFSNEHFRFLEPRGSKTFNDVKGHVLKTIKLRGCYSQGLILAAAIVPDGEQLADGTDVSEMLGVVKYEKPSPAELAGKVKGNFPTVFVGKTDAERVQNLTQWLEGVTSDDWFATEKIDGTSVTYINDDGVLRVASRNLELSEGDNNYWSAAADNNILDLLPTGWVCQGELFGEGIQGNPLGVKGQRVALFNVVAPGRVLVPRDEWPAGLKKLACPIYTDLQLPGSPEEALAQVDGIKSLVSPGRLAEGVVWHHKRGEKFMPLGDRGCFKAISNKYLLKTGFGEAYYKLW